MDQWEQKNKWKNNGDLLKLLYMYITLYLGSSSTSYTNDKSWQCDIQSSINTMYKIHLFSFVIAYDVIFSKVLQLI